MRVIRQERTASIISSDNGTRTHPFQRVINVEHDAAGTINFSSFRGSDYGAKDHQQHPLIGLLILGNLFNSQVLLIVTTDATDDSKDNLHGIALLIRMACVCIIF